MAKTQHNQNAPLVDDYQEPERPEASDNIQDHPRFNEEFNANMEARDNHEATLEQDARPRAHENDPDEPNRQTEDRPLDPKADRERLKTEALRKRDHAIDRYADKQKLAEDQQNELKERNKAEDTTKAKTQDKLREEQRERRTKPVHERDTQTQ